MLVQDWRVFMKVIQRFGAIRPAGLFLLDVAMILSLMSLALSIGLFVTPKGSNVSPDSVWYLDAAKDIASGKDLITTLEGWAPSYPILVSLFVYLGIAPVYAARIINIFSFGLAMLPLYLLGKMVGGRLNGVLTGLFSALSFVLIMVTSFAWAEATYIFFLSVCLYALVQYMQSEARIETFWLVFAACFADWACCTRYIGVLLLGVGLLAIGVKIRHGSWQRKANHIALLGFVTLAPVAIWFITGLGLADKLPSLWSLGGREQLKLSEYAIRALRTIFNGLFLTPTLNLGVMGNVRTVLLLPGVKLTLLTLGVGLIGLIIWYIRKNVRRVSFPRLSPEIWIPLTYIVLHVPVFIILPWLGRLSRVDNRYLSPTYPFLWLLITGSVLYALRYLGHWSKAIQVGASVLAAIVGLFLLLGQWQFIAQLRNEPPTWAFNSTRWQTDPAISYLSNRAQEQDIVYSNFPAPVYYLLERPVRHLNELLNAKCIVDSESSRAGEEKRIFVIWFVTEDELAPPENMCCQAGTRLAFDGSVVCEVQR